MKRATQYVLRQDLDTYPGGVPTSLVKSGQQWDFPNCWPPIEHILVQGLEATGLPDARHTSHSTPQFTMQFVKHFSILKVITYYIWKLCLSFINNP